MVIMTKQEIEFFIDENGNVRIDVKNGDGNLCLTETKDLEKKLGEVESREKKPEFYNQGSINNRKYNYLKK